MDGEKDEDKVEEGDEGGKENVAADEASEEGVDAVSVFGEEGDDEAEDGGGREDGSGMLVDGEGDGGEGMHLHAGVDEGGTVDGEEDGADGEKEEGGDGHGGACETMDGPPCETCDEGAEDEVEDDGEGEEGSEDDLGWVACVKVGEVLALGADSLESDDDEGEDEGGETGKTGDVLYDGLHGEPACTGSETEVDSGRAEDEDGCDETEGTWGEENWLVGAIEGEVEEESGDVQCDGECTAVDECPEHGGRVRIRKQETVIVPANLVLVDFDHTAGGTIYECSD
jgi:hypothetical protein